MTPHPLPRLGASPIPGCGRHAHAVDLIDDEETLDILVLVLGRLEVAEIALDPFLVDGGDDEEKGV